MVPNKHKIPLISFRQMLIVIATVAGIIIPLKLIKKPLTSNSVYIEKMELEYWKTKAFIIDDITKFMDQVPYHNIAPILVLKYADKYDVDPRLFLAQSFIESHYGTKGLARRTNSVCNVGAWDDGTITHKYSHPNESLEPYFKLISNHYLIDKTLEDLLKNFIDKNGNRYASYLYYEKELAIIWDKINTQTKLDSLLNIYNHYKLELNR